MNPFGAYPFVRLTLTLIAGILLGTWTGWELPLWILPLVFLLFLLNALIWRFRMLHGWGAGFFVFAAGILLVQQGTPGRSKDHLLHLDSSALRAIRGVVVEAPSLKPNSYQLDLQVREVRDSVGWRPASGRVRVFQPDEAYLEAVYGDELVIAANPDRPQPPLNPGEFNYRKYLFRQGITHTVFVRPGRVSKLGNEPPNPFKAFSLKIRTRGQQAIGDRIRNAQAKQVAEAMLLGMRDQMQPELKETYARTGAVHVLAVSGLHVGIIYGILYLLFLRHGSRKMRIITTITGILVLWLYAAVTGMAPSVQRATIMFSLFLLAQLLNRRSDIYNTVFMAAFLILMLDPFELFQVGFQLSFAAVIGIVFFQPRIYGLLSLSNRWLDRLWLLTSVSVAAQLTTGPIILYYFHAFPLLFWLSNLVVVPAAAVILYTGIPALVLNAIPYLADVLWWVLEVVLRIMNYLVGLIGSFSFSSVSVYTFDPVMLGITAVAVIVLMLMLRFHDVVWARMLLAVLLLFPVYSAINQVVGRQPKLVIYAGEEFIMDLVGHHSGISWYNDQPPNPETRRYTLEPARISMGLDPNAFKKIALPARSGVQAVRMGANTIVRLTGDTGPEQVLPLAPDVIILGAGFRASLQPAQLPDDLEVVLDATCPPWVINRVIREAETSSLTIFNMKRQGAYIKSI